MLVPSIFNDNFVDDMFDEMFAMPFETSRKMMKQSPMMNTDIQEYDNEYQMNLELPGFQKEDIQAELRNGYLVISATHAETNDEKDKTGRFIRKERYSGQCQRSFYVGKQVTQDEIKASFENGVLKLIIPKKPEEQPVDQKKYIAIEG